jgi:hypothetical protein
VAVNTIKTLLLGLHNKRNVALDYCGATLLAVGVGGWVNPWAGMIAAAPVLWILNNIHNGDG